MGSIADRQHEIEGAIAGSCGISDSQVLAARFSPSHLIFSRRGECALYVDDNNEEYGPYDDHDVGLVVCVLPRLRVCSQEEYALHILDEAALS